MLEAYLKLAFVMANVVHEQGPTSSFMFKLVVINQAEHFPTKYRQTIKVQAPKFNPNSSSKCPPAPAAPWHTRELIDKPRPLQATPPMMSKEENPEWAPAQRLNN